MKPILRTYIALFVILLFGTILRFYRITTVPPSLSHDETAIAYNAYSILKTGKDEYGNTFPMLFKSFDDYKLPGMVYASVPAVAAFGTTAMGARFTSAFLGSLTVLLVYLLVHELFGVSDKNRRYTAESYALASAFFFAISPWHINFSRQLFESNGALFFLSLAVYMLLRSLRSVRFLWLAAFFMGISVYLYYSVRLVIPFVVLAYWLINKKALARNMPVAILSLCLFVLTIVPIASQMFTRGGLERVSIVSIANDPNYHKWKGVFIRFYAEHQNPISKLFFNQKTALLWTAADNYWKNISPLQVFASGTSTYGLQHPFEIPLIVVGLLFFVSFPQPGKWLLIVWFLAAFLPGALSTNQPNALRTLLGSPFFSVCSGIGAIEILKAMDQRKRLWHGVAPFGVMLLYFLYTFYQSYFIVNATRNALAFGDGYEQMVRYVKTHESQYDRIVISGYYWRPYIFVLYWGDTDPRVYQNEGSKKGWGKYVFTGAQWDYNEIFLYDNSFDPKSLALPAPSKTLFILAKPEYERNSAKYTPIDIISGRHEPAVFTAASAK